MDLGLHAVSTRTRRPLCPIDFLPGQSDGSAKELGWNDDEQSPIDDRNHTRRRRRGISTGQRGQVSMVCASQARGRGDDAPERDLDLHLALGEPRFLEWKRGFLFVRPVLASLGSRRSRSPLPSIIADWVYNMMWRIGDAPAGTNRFPLRVTRMKGWP